MSGSKKISIMGSIPYSQSQREDNAKKYGFLGPTKVRDHLPLFHPFRTDASPYTVAFGVSSLLTALCCCWLGISLVGYIFNWIRNPLPSGETMNIALIFDTVPLNRWAVNVVVSCVSSVVLFLQSLWLGLSLWYGVRKRVFKEREDRGQIVPPEELQAMQLEEMKKRVKQKNTSHSGRNDDYGSSSRSRVPAVHFDSDINSLLNNNSYKPLTAQVSGSTRHDKSATEKASKTPALTVPSASAGRPSNRDPVLESAEKEMKRKRERERGTT